MLSAITFLLLFTFRGYSSYPGWLSGWSNIARRVPVAYFRVTDSTGGHESVEFLGRTGESLGCIYPPDLCGCISVAPNRKYTAFTVFSTVNTGNETVYIVDEAGHAGEISIAIPGVRTVWTVTNTLAIYTNIRDDFSMPSAVVSSDRSFKVPVIQVTTPIDQLSCATRSGRRAFAGYHDPYNPMLLSTKGFGGFWLDGSLCKSGPFLSEEKIFDLAVSPDAKYLAVQTQGGSGRSVFVYRSADQQLLQEHPLGEFDSMGEIYRSRRELPFCMISWNREQDVLAILVSGVKGKRASITTLDPASGSTRQFFVPVNKVSQGLWINGEDYMVCGETSPESSGRLYLLNTKTGSWTGKSSVPRGTQVEPIN